jgi:hypothetical protein
MQPFIRQFIRQDIGLHIVINKTITTFACYGTYKVHSEFKRTQNLSSAQKNRQSLPMADGPVI